MVKQHRYNWLKAVIFFRKRKLLALLLVIFLSISVVLLWQRLLIQTSGLLTQFLLIIRLKNLAIYLRWAASGRPAKLPDRRVVRRKFLDQSSTSR